MLSVNLVECLQSRGWCQSSWVEYLLMWVYKDSSNDGVMVVKGFNSRATYKWFNIQHLQVNCSECQVSTIQVTSKLSATLHLSATTVNTWINFLLHIIVITWDIHQSKVLVEYAQMDWWLGSKPSNMHLPKKYLQHTSDEN